MARSGTAVALCAPLNSGVGRRGSSGILVEGDRAVYLSRESIRAGGGTIARSGSQGAGLKWSLDS